MKQFFCNPLNFSYRYQFNQTTGGFTLNREAADPSLVLFQGKYYLFPSMTKGFLVSGDLVNWTQCPLTGVPVYDYAPGVLAVLLRQPQRGALRFLPHPGPGRRRV